MVNFRDAVPRKHKEAGDIRISPDWLKFNLIEGVVEVGDVGVPDQSDLSSKLLSLICFDFL